MTWKRKRERSSRGTAVRSNPIRRALGVLLCLSMLLSLMPTAALAAGTGSGTAARAEGGHIAPLQNELISGELGDESKWTSVQSSNGQGTFVFDKGADSVAITGSGANNAITYNGGPIETPNFLIQFDITTPATKDDADDFKVRMKEDADGNRLQVRFNFKAGVLGLEGINNAEAGARQWGWDSMEGFSAHFDWEPATAYPVDILVNGDTVTIYWNGSALVSAAHSDVKAMTPSALSFASQFGQQNHTISSLVVTAPEQAGTPAITAAGATVTIACETEGAKIYYTIDGSEPSAANGTAYAQPFTLAETETVKAIAVKDGMTDSAVAAQTVEIITGEHLAALQYGLVDGFSGGADWTNGAEDNFSITEDGSLNAKSATGGTLITYTYNNQLSADDLLIQYDWTLSNATPNVQFRTRFRVDGEGNCLQVRFHTTSGGSGNAHTENIYVGLFGADNTAIWGDKDPIGSFTLMTGETVKIDIKAEGSKITVYVNGGKVGSVQDPALDRPAGGFAFASNWQNQYTVSNLKITTADDPNQQTPWAAAPEITDHDGTVTITSATEGAEIYYTIDGSNPTTESTKYTAPFALEETGTVKAIAVKENMKGSVIASQYILVSVAASHVTDLLGAPTRTLLPTSALNSIDSWDTVGGTFTVADGVARLVTSGPNNRIGYQINKINADKFLISFDYTILNGSNTNTKVAFKAVSYDGDRLQVRFNPVQKEISIERGTSGSAGNTGTWNGSWCEWKEFNWKTGQTYGIDILVDGDTITVYVNGVETISKQHDDIAAMAPGYFAISTQYPTGDVTFENLSITTDQVPTGPQYTVTLESATDGVRNNTTGGTVTADTLTGYEDDLITLTVTPAHNYVFDRYDSYITSTGNSTDGLMPIANHMFTLNGKFGDVTVVANFVRRTPGRFELFYDDFAAAGLDSKYTAQAADKITQADGVVTIDAAGTNCLALDSSVWSAKLPNEGYRISVDAWKANSTAGTMQIMFKGAFDDRYVLVLNGTQAAIRHIDGTNTMLASADFAFSTAKSNLVLEVVGDTVTFTANGATVLTYTYDATKDHANHWDTAADAAGLINMTADAPVCFDNLLLERIPNEIGIALETSIVSNGSEAADTDHAAGVLSTSAYSGVEKDQIILTATPKLGYALDRIYVKDHPEITIANGVLTIPANLSGTITVVAAFKPSTPRAARSFYIDSVNGDDSGDGSINHPWRTLDQLAAYTDADPLVPGDQVLLRRGSVFNGQQLRFSGMGSAEAPVVIGAYGEGSALPRLNGNGEVPNVVTLFNQPYVTLSNLEITNTSPAYNSDFTLNSSNNTTLTLRAINVFAKDFGVVSGIKILNCYIHDVNGNINLKWNGGIFFDVQADIVNGQLVGIPTKYDDVLIEGCTFINVDRSGIKLVSSPWCNQWAPNNPAPISWYPSTNVVIRNNYMEKIGGDGITTRDTDGTLIEYNLVKDARYQNTAYNVAIWPFQAANTVIQHNETYNTHSTTDGQGLDCDHVSAYTLMQYNYSHNNEGGFMLIMGGYPHTAPTVRYNISQNDYDKTFEFAQGIPMGTMIYNNTLYSEAGVSRGVLFLSNTANGRGINDLYLFNNLFIYPEGQTFYGNQVDDLKTHAKLYNNAYVNGIAAPAEEARAITVANVANVLVDAGSAPETNSGTTPTLGSSGALDGYRLVNGCELVDKGVTIAQAIEHFGGAGFQLFDGRNLAPSVLETQYYGKSESSLKYVMGENFPQVSGVRYDLDFFGSSNHVGSAPDIGAAEAQTQAPSVPEGTVAYTVQRGDTLSSITANFYGNNAQRYALYDANLEAFRKTNGRLEAGMVLVIPATLGNATRLPIPVAGAGETLYTIRYGDTLGKIALQYYGSVAMYKAIYERNADRLVNPNLIYEGQVIVLPAK